jgi:hypothetical protein
MTTIDVDFPILAWARAAMAHRARKCSCDLDDTQLEAVRSHQPAATSAGDNLKTFSFAEAAYEAAVTGRGAIPVSGVRAGSINGENELASCVTNKKTYLRLCTAACLLPNPVPRQA